MDTAPFDRLCRRVLAQRLEDGSLLPNSADKASDPEFQRLRDEGIDNATTELESVMAVKRLAGILSGIFMVELFVAIGLVFTAITALAKSWYNEFTHVTSLLICLLVSYIVSHVLLIFFRKDGSMLLAGVVACSAYSSLLSGILIGLQLAS